MPVRTPTAAGEDLPKGVVSIPELLAGNVRAYRLLRRLEQDEVAGRMQSLGHGWRRATVSEIERSRRNVTVSELVGLAMALNVTVAELLDSRGPGGRAGPRVGLPVRTRRHEPYGEVTEDMPWFSVAAEDLGMLVCSHQRHVEILWDADGMYCGGLVVTEDAERPPQIFGDLKGTATP